LVRFVEEIKGSFCPGRFRVVTGHPLGILVLFGENVKHVQDLTVADGVVVNKGAGIGRP
jgi:hypothetical protein